MLEGDGGSIVNLASIVGLVGSANAPAYVLGPRTTSTAQRARR
jgi:short-subunit dehydrogenase